MARISLLLGLLFTHLFTLAQNNLTAGAQLLFKNVNCRLSSAQKNEIFNQTGFLLSANKQQFIQDKEGADFPFDALVLPTDLNKDGKEEIFIVFGNLYTSGNTGSSVLLFIQNSNGQYQPNLGFPGTMPDVLATSHNGYPDLLIGGPGFEYPIWRWNGKAYQLHKSINDHSLNAIKKTNLESISKAYTSSLRNQ